MNLILLDRNEIRHNQVELSGRRGRHIIDVLCAAVGDELRAGVVRGPTGTARVNSIQNDIVCLDLTLAETEPVEPKVEIVLAMPRPKVLATILQTAASFGVARIDVINAWRVDKSYLQSRRLEPMALREQLLIGCEQGSTTWLPDIAVWPRMMPFVDDNLTARVHCDETTALLAHPHADQHIEDVVSHRARKVIVAIGPEGGWIQRELDTFVDRGFAPISLGQRILRTHAAIAGLLAQLDMIARTRS